MTSIIAKIEAWFQHDETIVKEKFTEAEQWAIKTLKPSIEALAKLAEAKGVVVVEQAAVAAGEAAFGAIASGGSIAGQAAIAAGLAVVKDEAPDALHALSTAAVTAAKQAVADAAAAVATAVPATAETVNE